jgi:uncharacterized membrane protein
MTLNLLAETEQMPRVLEWLLGEKLLRKGTPHFYFENMPQSWGVFVFFLAIVLIAVLVFWMYRREISTCPPVKKVLLASIRFVVLMFLVFLWLRPTITFMAELETKPVVPVIRDASSSFSEKDVYRDEKLIDKLVAATGWDKSVFQDGNKSRAEILNQLMEKDQFALIDQLREQATVKVYDIHRILEQVAVMPARKKGDQANSGEEDEGEDTSENSQTKLQRLIASNPETDLRQGIKELLNNSKRMAAIILFSDGQHNGEDDVVQVAQQINKTSKKNRIPIFTVGIGDPSRPKDIKVADLFVRDTARPDEPFKIEARLNFDQLNKQSVTVELLEHTVDPQTGEPRNDPTPVEEVDVTVDPDESNNVRVDFQRTLNVPGKYAYSVRVRPIDGEIDTKNNVFDPPQVMQVIDEKVKVLLIAGAPTWEYRMVQRLLQRDQAISLSCWLQTMDIDRAQEGNEPIDVLPQTIEELGQYNVVMLFDPDPREFTEEWIETLKTFAKRKAGGVLYMAGPKFTSTFITLNRLNGIREILPVQFDDTDTIETDQALALMTNATAGKMMVIDHNLSHPVLSFHKDKTENRARWAEMPSIYWSFPTLKAKPATQVLMERHDLVNQEGNQPLIVSGRYGAGNVLYFGFNGTWRWRRVGVQAQYFDRFWIQVVRFLVETRSLQGSRRGVMDLDRSEYELGDAVTITARFLDEQFGPLALASVPAVITSENGDSREVEFKLVPGQEGLYEVRTVANATGAFQVFVNLPGADPDSVDKAGFQVVPPIAESRAKWLNEALLRDIAEASGGAYISIDELSTIAERIPVRPQTIETKTPPTPLWDLNPLLRYLTFGIPLVLLTFEWALRKWHRLL